MQRHATKNRNTLIGIACLIIIYFPVFWSIGFAYRLYGNMPWPGAALYTHICALLVLALSYKKLLSAATAAPIYSLATLFYIVLTIIYPLTYFALSSDAYAKDAMNESAVATFYFLVYISLGFYIYRIKWNNYVLFFILATFIIISAIAINPHAKIPVSLDSIYGEHSDVIVNYQIVSLSILFLLVFLYISNINWKSVLIFICFILIFLTGGRSEFVGSVAAFGFIISVKFLTPIIKRYSIKHHAVTVFFTITCSLFTIAAILSYYNIDISNNRNLQLFDLEHASSWQNRKLLKDRNWEVIENNPLIGQFGSHWEIEKGGYIHNIFSAWQEYGLLGFILLLIVLIYPLYWLLKMYLHRENKILLLPLAISFYCLLLMLFTKSVYWSYAGLVVGGLLYSKLMLKNSLDETHYANNNIA